MPVKSIIDVDVKDDSFKAFLEEFKKYKAGLDDMPAAWEKTDTSVQNVAEGLKSQADSLQKHGELVRKQVDDHQKIGRHLQENDRTMLSFARNTGEATKHFTEMTVSLLKWPAIVGTLSGLLGLGGGLFGIERIAESAASGRTETLSLGGVAGTAERKAFEANYGKFGIDPDAFLHKLANAQSSIADRARLNEAFDLRMSDDQIKELDPVWLAQRAERYGRQKFIANGSTLEGLDPRLRDFIGDNNFRGLAAHKESEFDEADAAVRKAAEAAPLRKKLDAAEESLENLKIQLDNSAKAIFEGLEVKAAIVAPGLISLSKGVEAVILRLVGGDGLDSNLQLVNVGLRRMGDDLQKGGFAELFSDIRDHLNNWVDKKFGVGAGNAARSAEKGVGDTLGFIFGGGVVGSFFRNPGNMFDFLTSVPMATPGAYDFSGGTGHIAIPALPGPSYPPGFLPISYTTGGDGGGPGGSYTPRGGGFGLHGGGKWQGGGAGNPWASLETQYGLPSGLLKTIEHMESGGRDVTSRAGAEGYFQFMPGTAKRFGINPHDEADSAKGAAMYFQQLLAMFSGDVEKAAAGYNLGEGKVMAAIQQYGAGWKDHVAPETQDYIRKVNASGVDLSASGLRGGEGGGGTAAVFIQINNNTGGSAIVTAQQISVPT